MEKEKKLILWFEETSIKDVPLVGGKNASLGEMYSNLTKLGINVPNGFAVTAHAYDLFLESNNLKSKIKDVLKDLNTKNIKNLQERGKKVRSLILRGKFPKELENEIKNAYKKLQKLYFKDVDVAVRSSATAEDLPSASFAGQQETYLNVRGEKNLLESIKKCFASLFTDRAISYRENQGFDHFQVKLSCGVQKMVRSDLASSGISFTLDPDTGFDKVIVINGTFGLGELIVQGRVIPDEWIVFKDGLEKGYKAIISKKISEKKEKLVYKKGSGIKSVTVPKKQHFTPTLSDDEALKLALWCYQIEKYFKRPMDIEWAKDGKTNELFIVQARPETIHSTKNKNIWEEFRLKEKGEVITTGIAVGTKVAQGRARIIKSPKEINKFKKGEILVTEITDPDWEPIMKMASGIITDKGSRTSHAAIVSRELNIACVVGTENATKKIKNGELITLDASSGSEGVIYKGLLPYEKVVHDTESLKEPKVHIMVNIASPNDAFKNHFLPAKGVGLAREEFIIASDIDFHPNALIDFPKLKDKKLKDEIKKASVLYKDKKEFYVDKLAYGISKIAVTFYPYPVIVRFSDFKSNEYRNLKGGELYEPKEENPMIGFRGASRYYSKEFKEAFKLEVLAMKKAREEFGLTNIVPMIPFCRTTEELKKVLDIIENEVGLIRDIEHNQSCQKPVEKCDHLRIYMMCEIPSNVILAEEFLQLVDGYSIGSNDLTQLTLGIDRDSGLLSHIGNENDESVKSLIKKAIQKANQMKKYIGICGQAPSDIEGYAEFLIDAGIQSISLNPDSVIKTIAKISKDN